MELSNEFEVPVPVDDAWAILTDVERIAPCLPGAELQEVEGDEYRGVVKVKVGPITAQYKGKATFVERAEDAKRAVLDASGRDTRGQGNARATIVAQLTPTEGGTHVSVDTDLSVTGKVAQFGRGVMADVSAKLMTEFVDNLKTTVLTPQGPERLGGGAATSGATMPEAGAPARGDGGGAPERSVETEAVDLVRLAGGSIARRLVPALLVVAAIVVVLVLVL